MEGKNFRLGEYRIIDFGSGLVEWEAHCNFGLQRSGRCHQLGEVLVLGDFEVEKTGYLKGEFLERLRTLPHWDRTRYFCLASQLKPASTGRGLDTDRLKEIGILQVKGKPPLDGTGADRTGAFRLGRYRIIAIPARGLAWETWGEGNTIETGNCVVESGILLMGPSQGPSREENKREFIQNLRRLPQWQETLLWCRQEVLQPTQAPPKPKRPWPLPYSQIPKPQMARAGTAQRFAYESKLERPKQKRFKRWMPAWPDLWRPWNPKLPGLPRVRSFLASGTKFLSLPRTFFRRLRPTQPRTLPVSRKTPGKKRILWAGFLVAAILLAILAMILYRVLHSDHDHFHYWKHQYKSKDH